MKDFVLRLLGTSSLVAVFAMLCVSLAQSDRQVPVQSMQDDRDVIVSTAQSKTVTRSDRGDAFYSEITRRPIFELTRRPITLRVPEQARPPKKPIVVVPEPAETVRSKLQLLGVMTDDTVPSVLISVDGGEPVWLSEGESIGGWTISEAGPNWLDISAGDDQIRLDLFE